MYDNEYKSEAVEVSVKKVKSKVEKLEDKVEALKLKREGVLSKRKEEDKVYNDQLGSLESELEVEEDKALLVAIKKAKKEGKDLSVLGF